MVAGVGRSDRTAWLVAFGVVVLAAGASLVLHGRLGDVVGQIPWFLRTYAAVIGPCELVAALLLAMRASALRTRRSALLGAAYAFSAPLVLANLASLPGIFGPQGAFAHQTPPWCWLAWHAGWSTWIVIFAWTPDGPIRRPAPIVAAGLVSGLAFALLALRADVWLPPVLGAGDTNTPLLLVIGWSTVALLAIAALGLGILRNTALDAFVLVAVVALALDEAFVLTTSVRFSIGTYMARALGAINAVSVLAAIATEFGGAFYDARGSLRERVARAAHVRREATLQQIAQTTAQLVWIAGPDGRFEWFNPRWFAYTGQTPESATLFGWAAVVHPADAVAAQRWPDALRTGEPLTLEARLRAADGTYRWFLTRFEPIRDTEKRIVKWYGSATAQPTPHDPGAHPAR